MSNSRTRAAVGFSVHTGWAAAVTVAGSPPCLLDRRKMVLADEQARFVYHSAAEKVGQAKRMIQKAETTAQDRAITFLEKLKQDLPKHQIVVALPDAKRILPPLQTILKSHPMIHTAEGELYRKSIAEAAKKLGMRVEITKEGELPLFGKMSPPWGKDQKTAAALAWAALGQ